MHKFNSRVFRPSKSIFNRPFGSIPIVDISPFTMPALVSKEDKYKAAKQLTKACQDVGFVYLNGHGVSQELLDETRGVGRQFFELPLSKKESISIANSTSYRGYQRMAKNITLGKLDLHEGIDFYREYPSDHPLVLSDTSLAKGKNQWPDPADVPNFRPTIEAYVKSMNCLGNHIMRAIAIGLELDENYFEQAYNDPHWSMRLIGYPPTSNISRTDEHGIGCGEHSDYGCLTFVNQDNIPNTLQVRSSNGEWIFADPIPGAIVMNIGDMLHQWTNGLFQATPHRVLSPQVNAFRLSAPFFFEPNFTTLVAPIPLLTQDPLFDGIMYGDHLKTKVEQNFV